MTSIRQQKELLAARKYLFSQAVVICLAAWLFFFMEWVFLATMPSFMRALSLPQQVVLLLFTAGLAAGLSLLAALPFMLAGLLPGLRRFRALLAVPARLIAALWLASLALLLVDNFTYVVLKFGIVNAQGAARGLYIAFFIGTLAVAYRETGAAARSIEGYLQGGPSAASRLPARIFAALTGASLLVSIFFLFSGLNQWFHQQRGEALAAQNRPHIILITADGINAVNMSAYGYERDTTPFLRNLRQTSLFAENAFTNASNTSGSLISLLSGRNPTATRVLYPPDTLQGEDAYLHLPGILRSMGYLTVQFSFPYYADACHLNMQQGFEICNDRQVSSSVLMQVRKLLPGSNASFIYESGTRLASRLAHIFFIRDMDNPYQAVTKTPEMIDDGEKLAKTLALLDDVDQPLFLHLHYMSTHGPTFYPQTQVFSAGQNPADQEPWNDDFYDDAILQFDGFVETIVKALQAGGMYDDTILFIGSDHGKKSTTVTRLPFLIHFPGGERSGVLRSDVQNLDLAPTLLDYLDAPLPDWMEGTSLLRGEPGSRPIFSTVIGTPAQNSGGPFQDFMSLDPGKVKPPFYQFEIIAVIDCNHAFRFHLNDIEWSRIPVAGHTGACYSDEEWNDARAFAEMLAHLRSAGFDVTSIENWNPPGP